MNYILFWFIFGKSWKVSNPPGVGRWADCRFASRGCFRSTCAAKKNCFSHLLGMIDEFGWMFIPLKKMGKNKGKMTHRWVWAKIYDPGKSQNWVTLVASAGQFDTRGLIWRLGI